MNKSFSKVILWLPFFFLLVFVVDIFFSVPNADDYDFFTRINNLGFFGFQEFMYQHQNGRFISSFFVACYSALFNMVHVYWIFPFLFFLSLYAALFFFVKNFFEYLNFRVDNISYNSYAAWLMLLFILVCMELSSFLFWMPGIITYQLPVTFLILGVAFLLKFNRKKNTFSIVAALIFFALASGCQELIFLLAAPALFITIIANWKNTWLRNTSILVTVCMLIPFLISVYSPGTGTRQEAATNAGITVTAAVSGAVFRASFLFSSLLTIPYLYVVMAIVFIFFSKIKNIKLLTSFKKYPVYILVFLTFAQPFFIYLVTMMSFNSGLPERADNLLLIQATVMLLLVAAAVGIGNSIRFSFHDAGHLQKLILFFLVTLCISSFNFHEGVKAMYAGYIYKQVEKGRIKNASYQNGVRVLSLTGYEDEVRSFYRQQYGKEISPKLFNVAKRNHIIVFRDVYDLLGGQNRSFRHYYKIDTVKTPAIIAYGDTLIHLPFKK